jgi:hypothetical protein
MLTTAFHNLVEPTRANEIFWDAQLDLIHTRPQLTFDEILRDVDAYYLAP